MSKVRAWIRARTPRQILVGAQTLFMLYAWPGFVGWDTYEHILQARAGVYTDGHPPAIARLQRLCELFVTGPLLMMLIQSISLLVGLYLLLRTRVSPRRAAVLASAIFLFPVVSGVTGLVAKDVLMAGPAMIGIALLLDDRRGRQWLAVGFLMFASLMRWNAVAATFAPMLFLFRWRPGIAGVRRYVIALAVWVGFTGVAFGVNEALTTKPEYYWYWSHAYEDIAGTLQYVEGVDDATVKTWLDGVPLVVNRDIQKKLRENYDPAQYFQLVRDPKTAVFAMPETEAHRTAIKRAWNQIVFGNFGAYLHYRYDNFRRVLGIDGIETFSRVYVWLTVIAAEETIPLIEYDAHHGVIQGWLVRASKWVSLTPMYIPIWYFVLLFLLLPFAIRRRLDIAIVLSGIGYELQWFFLAPTPDIRYSQWMVICSLVALTLVITAWRSKTNAGLPANEPGK